MDRILWALAPLLLLALGAALSGAGCRAVGTQDDMAKPGSMETRTYQVFGMS